MNLLSLDKTEKSSEEKEVAEADIGVASEEEGTDLMSLEEDSEEEAIIQEEMVTDPPLFNNLSRDTIEEPEVDTEVQEVAREEAAREQEAKDTEFHIPQKLSCLEKQKNN